MVGVQLLAPIALRSVLAQGLSRLETAAGVPVHLTLDLTPQIASRIAAGQPFDVGIANPHHVRDLAAAGRIDGQSASPFGKIPLAVGRRADRPAPVPTDADEIADLLRGARSIGYTGAGTSGQVFLETMARMGLAQAVAAKSRALAAGRPVASALTGEVELAVVPLTTILSSPGLVPVAIFPESLGSHISLVVFQGRFPSNGAVDLRTALLDRMFVGDLASAGVIRTPPR
jgi:molybdate transport system substrate-binding protein